jgi:hypothetical protein
MMRQRGDLDCLHEPFGEAWYQGESPLWHRFRPGDRTTPGLSLATVWDDLRERAIKGPVFIKDFPHYVSHLWDTEFLAHFKHAFLIRDPAKTITSMHDKWPDFHEGEVGFPEQRALFDLLWALGGSPPPVIDSDDLLEHPQAMVKAFCEAVDIPYIAEALEWEAGADMNELSWWDGGSFHAKLATSTGLAPQPRRYVNLEELPDRVRQIHRRMKPHYNRLFAHRLSPPVSTA